MCLICLHLLPRVSNTQKLQEYEHVEDQSRHSDEIKNVSIYSLQIPEVNDLPAEYKPLDLTFILSVILWTTPGNDD